MSEHGQPNKLRFNKLQALLLDLLAKFTVSISVSKKKRIAELLTFLAFDIIKIRRKYVINALQEHLGYSQAKSLKMARKIYLNFLLNSMEMSGLKYFTQESLLSRVNIEGLEHLQEALSRKKGAIIVSGHYGLWELVPPWLAINDFPVTVVVRRQNNPEVDKWMEDMRQKHGPKTTDSGYGLREILKSLRKGEILALMVDQDNGKQGIFVKFLNKWASAPVGPAQISLRTKSPIVPLTMIPNYKGKHLLKIFPAFYPENYENNTEGQQKLSQDYTDVLEQLVKKFPQQWFWLHRRWKHQPKDCPQNPWVQLIKKSKI